MNGKVVAFMNMKGGVGKTTVCVNLAHCLSMYKKKKVLIIDMDPQANTSQYILTQQKYREILEEGKTIFKIYKSFFESISYSSVDESIDEKVEEENLTIEVNENLFLIPGDLNMVRLSRGADSNANLKLETFIREKNFLENFDFIFIDCPPTQSIYTDSALNTSDYYILPVKPDFLSTIGINLVKRMIKLHNNNGLKKVKCAGIIINMLHNQSYEKEMVEKIKQENISDIYESIIKYTTKVSEGAENQKYLLNINGHKKIIKNIAETFLERVK